MIMEVSRGDLNAKAKRSQCWWLASEGEEKKEEEKAMHDDDREDDRARANSDYFY